jgi:hypothetical protein
MENWTYMLIGLKLGQVGSHVLPPGGSMSYRYVSLLSLVKKITKLLIATQLLKLE